MGMEDVVSVCKGSSVVKYVGGIDIVIMVFSAKMVKNTYDKYIIHCGKLKILAMN